MRIPEDRRAQLEATLPSSLSTRERAAAYMSTLDVPLPLFASTIGYSGTSLRSFLNNRFEAQNGASDLLIRHALETYMDSNPLGAKSQSTETIYETGNVEQLRYWFEQCLKHGHMAVIYGPPGSQKTFVARHLVAEFNRVHLGRNGSSDRAYLVRCSVNIRPRDLIAKICTEMGLPTGGTLQRCLASIRLGLRNRRVLLIIDECQLAGIDALEALRELHDEDVGLILLGSHKLRQLFESRAAELEQFNSRLEDSVELAGITAECARAILKVELPQLDDRAIQSAVAAAFVPDIYSREKGKTYCSMRRLFKSIHAFRQLAQEAATPAKESIQ